MRPSTRKKTTIPHRISSSTRAFELCQENDWEITLYEVDDNDYPVVEIYDDATSLSSSGRNLIEAVNAMLEARVRKKKPPTPKTFGTRDHDVWLVDAALDVSGMGNEAYGTLITLKDFLMSKKTHVLSSAQRKGLSKFLSLDVPNEEKTSAKTKKKTTKKLLSNELVSGTKQKHVRKHAQKR